MVEQLNAIARLWWEWSAAMFWQAGLLIVLIGCVDLFIRKWAWPQLRYALWTLILIKLLLPPTLSLPSGIVPELGPVASQVLRSMSSEKVAREPAAIADFGLQIADLDRNGDSQLAGPAVSNLQFEISDSSLAANPQSAITNPQLSWQFHAMLAWLTGTSILGLWLYLRLHSLCGRHAYRAAAASLPQSFYNQMADCANRLGLRHVPRVVVTKRLASPAVFGAVRPVLLMPKGYLSKLSRRDTEHMLLHELAHVKRGDLVMHSLYMLLQIAYWYNPLLWLVRRQMHHLRELSCDATVADLLRERTLAYRQTLLETARRLLATSVEPGLGLLGLFEDSNRLLVRLNWLTKPTWRHRTMKRTVVVAIAALMIACVLPMARAQESAPTEVTVVTREVAPTHVEEYNQQSRDSTSQDLKVFQRHLDQMMAQQKELQNQLRILAEQRHAMSAGQAQDQQQEFDSLRKQLQMLSDQQRDLQKQLRALSEERRPVAESRRESIYTTNENVDVTVSPKETPESADQVKRELKERERAVVIKRKAQVESQRATAEAAKAQAKAQLQQADTMKAWGEQMKQWEQSDQMQQWRREMADWQKQVQEWAQNLAKAQANAQGESPDMVPPAPMPPMPEMPKMPLMPHSSGIVKKEMKLKHERVDPTGDGAEAGYNMDIAVTAPEAEAPEIAAPEVPEPPMPPMPPVPPVPPVPPAAPEHREEAEVRTLRIIELAPGQLVDVKNEMGSISVRGGDEPVCKLTVTVKGGAETADEARRIAEQAEPIIAPTQDGVSITMPKFESDPQSNGSGRTVTMELVVPHDVRLKATQAFGDIRLNNLDGSIQVVSNMGSIRAIQTRGKVALESNMGEIEFIVPENLSARVQAKADFGSIDSDVPLEMPKQDEFSMGAKASGVIGGGEGTVALKTNMGSIRILSKEPSPSQRSERIRHEVRVRPQPQPRPDPRPEPQSEDVF